MPDGAPDRCRLLPAPPRRLRRWRRRRERGEGLGAGLARSAEPDGADGEAGLVPERAEFLQYHVHAHLDVFFNGEPVTVPAGIGIDTTNPAVISDEQGVGLKHECDKPCISPLHTHATDGVLHTETKTPEPNTLGQFFIQWDVKLDASCVGEFCAPDTPIGVYVDGEDTTAIRGRSSSATCERSRSSSARHPTRFRQNSLRVRIFMALMIHRASRPTTRGTSSTRGRSLGDRPDPDCRRRGPLLLGLRRQAVPRLRVAARQRLARTPAPEGRRRDQGAGGAPLHDRADDGERAPLRARAAARGRHARATCRCRSSRTAAPRRTRTRSSSPAGTRAGRRSWRATARTTARPQERSRDRRPAALAGRAGSPGVVRILDPYTYRCPAGHPDPCPVCSGAPHFEEVLQYEGPQNVAAVILETVLVGTAHPAAARLSAVGPRGLRPPRDPADPRRGDGRVRAHRQVVRLRELGCRPGHHDAGQGDQLRLRAARGDGHFGADRGVGSGPVLRRRATYSGHPLACAAGVASIEAFREEGIVENAAEMGEVLGDGLAALADKHESIGEVRGLGSSMASSS